MIFSFFNIESYRYWTKHFLFQTEQLTGTSDCDTGFDYLGTLAYFWSSTDVSEFDAWYRCIKN